MNKVQEVLLNALGLEVDQEFNFEFESAGETYRMKFTYEDNKLKPMIKSENKWKPCYAYQDLIDNSDKIYPIKKPILDNVEKKYLENVLRPFKDRIDCVLKRIWFANHHIKISLDNESETFTLPTFKPETMYKGMKLDKKYTLEALGLFEGE